MYSKQQCIARKVTHTYSFYISLWYCVGLQYLHDATLLKRFSLKIGAYKIWLQHNLLNISKLSKKDLSSDQTVSHKSASTVSVRFNINLYIWREIKYVMQLYKE